jgi:hypothetical protein
MSEEMPEMKKYNVFQISNLDPKLAAGDPEYPKAVLVGVFDQYIRMLFPATVLNGDLTEDSPRAKEMVSFMEQKHFNFLISTHFPKTAETLAKLGPRYSSVIKSAKPPIYTFVFEPSRVFQFRKLLYRKARKNRSLLPRAFAGKYWWLDGVMSPF